MPSFVTSNDCDEEALTDWKERLNDSTHFLHLFTNNITPVPATALGDLVEATFAGYAPIDMTGKWGAIFKVLNGLYQMDSDVVEFTATVGANETCYGWYIADDTILKFSKRFAAPILFTPTVVASIKLSPQVFSVSILE